MATVRTNKRENPFSQIDRYVFENDDSISWKAKGLMGYLLTRPNDWKINHKDLVNRAKDGKDAVTSALKELQKAGYIHYFQERLPNGKFGDWIYDVYERPEFNPTYNNDSPNTEKPYTDKPHTDKPNTDKTDYTNNNLTDNNLTNNKKDLVNKESHMDLENSYFQGDLIDIANEFYSELAQGRWSKKQWNIIIDKFTMEIIESQIIMKNPKLYIYCSLKKIAYKHDLKNGKVEFADKFASGEMPYYDWLND